MSNDNYPDGLANHPDAPWNQEDAREGYSEKHFEIGIEDVFEEELAIAFRPLFTRFESIEQMPFAKRVAAHEELAGDILKAFRGLHDQIITAAAEHALEDPEFQNPEIYHDE